MTRTAGIGGSPASALRRRRLTVAFLGVCATICALALLAPAIATAAPRALAPDIANSPALANLSACLAEKKQGDLVLLMDTSGSLGTEVSGDQATNPAGVRVDAAQVLLDRLAASQASSGAAIDVALVGLAGTTPWSGISPR